MSGRLVLLRTGLALTAALQTGVGGWLALAPRSFYTTVPTVDRYPPFSEHAFRDFGGASLGIAVVLVAATVFLERRLVCTALLAYLVFAGGHLFFHVTDHGHAMPHGEFVLQAVALSLATVLPAGLLGFALAGGVFPGRGAMARSAPPGDRAG